MVNWWVLPLNYLLGSFPCGLIVGWITKGVDIREYGSGSIGATNVSRVAGFLPALIAGVGDASKGFLGAYLATRFLPDPYLWFLALFLLIVGHDWSIFLRFRGGKGVATTLGILFYLSWESALLCFLVWVVMASITRYSSVGSLSGALLMPVFLYLWGKPPEFIVWGIFAAALVFWRHKGNIQRLIQGKELKMGQKGA
ncbi:MAG TPA: glycerol-3-phosphate 1-O-acyltransferase PlsY [Candidatus Atribacteria bacterium]|jgi:glycerol-3-phosphate acyltransferase PlsY|nr:glycerol-3-phosphate 1-O-acyltransferase PlsY [Atribacterota bacterium]HOA99491.1 glycerol-3-phosphate 1-O-acyltransferase PlsY [Candidatus Atribacteria bacterium]MDY0134734.1 glycerol-3-phosphate 1-O-acyltransferase PlsY [Atribacterota bacterium]HOQ51286.1 glycerol-3-phosphate 1-O-acyltransferase PlsY [Candidatus Atribacteria bacterium]HPT63981.1 glycerol-3-phosphate 1-O-acyltransferase PlsY [Candidatus Atribacteria bacterium]